MEIFCFIFYAFIEGWRDANEDFLNHVEKVKKASFNIHDIRWIGRAMVACAMSLLNHYLSVMAIVSAVAMALIFSLIHNGVMYERQAKLNPVLQKMNWGWRSTTGSMPGTLTNAKNSFSFTERVVMALVGVAIYTLGLIFLT